ncbi:MULTISPECIES: hypothetical protein [unclassified Agrococcus]|uniref:hypothetical protein n=1 Tax=unclassified Agrococcus TaxID=2615065 RepID=UPI0036102C3A
MPIPTIAELAIPVGLDDATRTSAVVEAVNRWLSAGIGPEALDLADTAEVNDDPDAYAGGDLWAGDFALLVARAQTPIHAEALFGPEWQTSISPTTISTLEVMNAADLTEALVGYPTVATSGGPYSASELESTTVNADGSSTYALQVRNGDGGHRTWAFTTTEVEGRTVLLEPFDLVLSSHP